MSSPSSKSNSTSADGDAKAKSLYRRFLDVRESVLRHKWLKSEEAGSDIGFEAALVDWVKTSASENSEVTDT